MCCSDTGSCCPLLGCRELLMLTCSFQGEKNKLNKIQINEKWFLCRNKLHLHSPQGGSSTGCVCVCVCSLTLLGCVVQRDDTKPSFVSLLEDPLSVWLAALLFMRTCVHACHTGAALWKHWVLLALAAGQRLPAILLLWNGPLFCWCCAGLWLKHEVETDYSNICRVQHDVYGFLVTRQARPSTLEYCLIFRLSLSAAADALSTACACFR